MTNSEPNQNQANPKTSESNGDESSDQRKLPDSADDDLREKVEQALAEIIPPDGERAEIANTVVSVVRRERFRGPLPHPKHLSAYEEISEGLAGRIVAMAEFAQQRGEDRQDRIVDYEYRDRRIGMLCGLAALALLVVAGTILFLEDQPAAGTALFSVAALGTIVSSFVRGRGDFRWPWERGEPEKLPAPKNEANS